MFEPGVLELYVRTLGSGTLCSNPGFGELHVRTPSSGTPPPSPREFEPWVRELHVRTRGLGNSMLEPRVLVLPLPPGSSNPGFGNSMFEPGVWGTRCEPRGLELLPPSPPRELEPWVRELHVPSNFKEQLSRGHAPSSFGEGGLEKGGHQPPAVSRSLPTTKKKIVMASPCHKRRRGHTKPLYGAFLRRNKRKRKQRKRLSMRSSSSQGGLRRGWKSPSRFLKPRTNECLNPGFEHTQSSRTQSLGTLCSNPRFWNSMFEPWVRELYVRTRGLENSMFEPRVRELLPLPQRVRTLGSGTPCSNPGFGVNPGVWNSSPPPPQEVRTLGSGTPCSVKLQRAAE